MRSKPPIPLVLIFSVVCFALGVSSVVLTQQDGSRERAIPVVSRATATVPVGSTPSQQAVLILGVDSLEIPEPSLLAIWLATLRPPARDVFLLGFPTDLPIGLEDLAPAHERFRWDPETGPDLEFLTSLQAVTVLPPRLVVVLDRVGFAAVVDYAGGIDLNGVPITGEEVIAVLDLWRDDPTARVETQARVLEALTLRGPSIGATPDLTRLVSLIPTHAFLSSDVADAALLLAPLLPIEPSTLRVTTLSLRLRPETPEPRAPDASGLAPDGFRR
jgi:hypothetical protein